MISTTPRPLRRGAESEGRKIVAQHVSAGSRTDSGQVRQDDTHPHFVDGRNSSRSSGVYSFVQIWARTRRLIFAVVIVAGLLCAGAWTYTARQARRAESMLAEASGVRIGDSEASVLPLVERYGGHKWAPPGSTRGTLGPREDWIDLEEYDRALNTYPDYVYSIQVNPWGSPTLAPSSKAAQALRIAMMIVPGRVRSPLGLRDWGSFVSIQIRDGRVSKVGATLFVEGRSRWLNHSWYLATDMRNEPLPLRPYTIEGENVLMREDRSIGIRNLITPQATAEQAEAAHTWNTACIVSLRGCSNRCELSPRAFQYWNTHRSPSGPTWEPTCE